jgi:hypothetical protein
VFSGLSSLLTRDVAGQSGMIAVRAATAGGAVPWMPLTRAVGMPGMVAARRRGVPLQDVQEAAAHAGPRTTMRHDRARASPDQHATYARGSRSRPGVSKPRGTGDPVRWVGD